MVPTVEFARQIARAHARGTVMEPVMVIASNRAIVNRVMALAARATEMLDV